jgi:hypothetical protein
LTKWLALIGKLRRPGKISSKSLSDTSLINPCNMIGSRAILLPTCKALHCLENLLAC